MGKTQNHRSIIVQWLAVGGGWWLVAVGSWHLAVVVAIGSGWWLVAVSGWQLAVGGGWRRLAVLLGCP